MLKRPPMLSRWPFFMIDISVETQYLVCLFQQMILYRDTKYWAFDPSKQLEEKYGLTPYEVSEYGAKYYKKDIGNNQYIHITIMSAVTISIRHALSDEPTIYVANRYLCEKEEDLDFLLLNGYIRADFINDSILTQHLL